MPSLTCTNCGRRTPLPTQLSTCANCGASLPTSNLGPMGQPSSNSIRSSAPFPPGKSNPGSRQGTPGSVIRSSAPITPNMQPIGNNLPVPYTPNPPNSPVSATPSVTPIPRSRKSPVAGPQGQGLAIFQPTVNAAVMRPPDLEGTIALPPTTHEVMVGMDWSEIVLVILLWIFILPIALFFEPAILILRLGGRGRNAQKMTVTTVRVQRTHGGVRNAVFEGDIRGSGISLGDSVALWGQDRGGTLVVQQGINHTTNDAILLARPMGPRIARVIVYILLGIMAFSMLVGLLSSIFPHY